MAYQPAGNLTTTVSIAHLATVYYDRVALTALRQKNMFWKGVETRTLPLKNGKTIQFYRYSNLGANTVATTEGTVDTSLALTSTTLSATVSQYADYINFSDLLVDTAIDGDIIAVGADQLGYRAGISCDQVIRAEVDSHAVSIDVPLLGSFFSSADLAGLRARYAGANVPPLAGGYFMALAHPYVTYDFLHDPQVGGFTDVVKQAANVQGNERLFTLEDRGFVARINGFELWEHTGVTEVVGVPNKYRIYSFGAEGIAAIDLAGRGPTRSQDQNQMKFKVNVARFTSPTQADPENKIRGLASYNFVFVAKTMDTTNYRIQKIDAPSGLGL